MAAPTVVTRQVENASDGILGDPIGRLEGPRFQALMSRTNEKRRVHRTFATMRGTLLQFSHWQGVGELGFGLVCNRRTKRKCAEVRTPASFGSVARESSYWLSGPSVGSESSSSTISTIVATDSQCTLDRTVRGSRLLRSLRPALPSAIGVETVPVVTIARGCLRTPTIGSAGAISSNRQS